jgi:hypothetical protein
MPRYSASPSLTMHNAHVRLRSDASEVAYHFENITQVRTLVNWSPKLARSQP